MITDHYLGGATFPAKGAEGGLNASHGGFLVVWRYQGGAEQREFHPKRSPAVALARALRRQDLHRQAHWKDYKPLITLKVYRAEVSIRTHVSSALPDDQVAGELHP